MTFNLSDSGPEVFKDVRVRQALAYALDRSVITEKILQAGQIMHSPLLLARLQGLKFLR